MTALEKTLPVVEVYGPVVQGEGMLIGVPTVFVRLGGCDFRCSWCDSLYAVDAAHYKHTWAATAVAAIVDRVDDLAGGGGIVVTLSGGNPALHNLGPLIRALNARGHKTAIETQGSVAKPWFALLDFLVLSPKPPSSGMTYSEEKLRACLAAGAGVPQAFLKIVVADEADYAFARARVAEFPGMAMVLQVCNPLPAPATTAALLASLDRLSRWVIRDRWYDVRVLPQLHTLVHGNARGV